MKILVLPDLHLHLPLLDKTNALLEAHPDWDCVSLGDWFDDWQRPVADYERTIERFTALIEKYPYRFTLLWGNHDFGYWSYPGHHSGYIADAKDAVRGFLTQLHTTLPLARPLALTYMRDGVIFSHAGLTLGFHKRYLEQARRYPYQSFLAWADDAPLPTIWENDSPLWHRPHNNPHKNTFNPTFLQVVGHTPVPTVTHTKEDNILYTDTWSTDSERTPLGDKSLAVVNTETHEWEVIK